MTGNEGRGGSPVTTAEQIADIVRATADEIYDPCSMALGLNVGLVEMGLVRELTLERGPLGWEISLRLRLTSPGCQYFFYFQQEIEARLLRHPDISQVRVTWDPQLDWTPEDMAPSARERIERRQRLLRPLPR